METQGKFSIISQLYNRPMSTVVRDYNQTLDMKAVVRMYDREDEVIRMQKELISGVSVTCSYDQMKEILKSNYFRIMNFVTNKDNTYTLTSNFGIAK